MLRGRGGDADRDGGRPVVLLRGDMDALPVSEDVAWTSCRSHEGLMHACGHDLHVAGLVGAARILHELRDELAGDVVFMFQPGEEGPGGAGSMIGEGVLEAAGQARRRGLRTARLLLGVTRWGVVQPSRAADGGRRRGAGAGRRRGRARVGAAPRQGPDPRAVRDGRRAADDGDPQFDVFDPVVITVGRIGGGTKDNIIPDDAVFEATVRSLSEEARRRGRRIELLATGSPRRTG